MLTVLHYWLPVLLWAGLILLLSRSDFQTGFTLKVLKAVVAFLSLDVSLATLMKINAVVRKLAHVSEYFILGLLVWRALRQGAAVAWRGRWAAGTLGIGLVWAAGDEAYQRFQRGRHGSPLDVGFDTLGLLLALLLVYGWSRRAESKETELPPR